MAHVICNMIKFTNMKFQSPVLDVFIRQWTSSISPKFGQAEIFSGKQMCSDTCPKGNCPNNLSVKACILAVIRAERIYLRSKTNRGLGYKLDVNSYRVTLDCIMRDFL